MSRFTYATPAAIAALALLAACGGDAGKADSALAADSSLNRDLKLAGTDTAAQPQLADVPKAPPTKAKAPVAKAPTKTVAKAPPPAPPRPTMGTVASGTALSLTAGSEICTNTSKVGDTFTATLIDPVAGSNGANIPTGAVVSFTVTTLKRSENVNDAIVMVYSVNSVAFGGKSYPVNAAVTTVAIDKVKNVPKGTTAKNVAGGAAVGAIAGQLLGKNTKATVIGAAVGAAAGAGAAAAAANYEGCMRAGSTIVVTLQSALDVAVGGN